MNNYRVTITETNGLRYVWFSTADTEAEALAQLMPEMIAANIAVSSVKVTALDNDTEEIARKLKELVN